MKKSFRTRILLFFIIALLGVVRFSFAKDPIRTEDSIVILGGVMQETGIIADTNGKVFLEFGENTRVRNTRDKFPFEGEILPPQIIALPDKRPRARMEEYFTFEILADTADELSFVDKFDVMNNKNRLRYQLLYPETFKRTSAVKVLIPITGEYSLPALWEYRGEEDGWTSLGGKVEETAEPDTSVFSSFIYGTGVFTLFEEDPSPDFVPTFPLDEIILAEPDPFAETLGDEVGTEELPPFIEKEIPEEAPLLPSAPEELPEEILVPAIEVEGETPTNPDAIIPVEINQPLEPILEEDKGLPSSVPPESTLPQTGPESDTPMQKNFPIGIAIAFLFLGISAYMAFKKPKIG